MSDETAIINYKVAGPTLARFHASNEFIRGIRGPRGSGKSTGCCAEIFKRSNEQAPGPDKIRHTRWAIIRNTYRELEDTTLKTWLRWWKQEHFGRFNYRTMSHMIRYKGVESEVLFRALDRPGDVKKVLSLDLTGAWINEARETPFGIVEALTDSVGRYPDPDEGGATWSGILLDTNSPDDDHWWYRVENECPKYWAFFIQPGGLIERTDGNESTFEPNPLAENLKNLSEGVGYYVKRASGKTKQHIRIYYCNQYGFIVEGRPVVPEYIDAIHFNESILGPVPGRPIAIGLDFGLTPAAIFGQRLTFGRYIWFDELVTENMGAIRFGELLKAQIAELYPNCEIEGIWGDPAGDDRVGTDEKTVFQVLNAMGIPAKEAGSQDPMLRREALAVPLSRLVDGKPALQIGPKVKIARKGLAGGYAYRRLQVAGQERYQNKPDKNRYSHPVEAGEYLMVGYGEGKKLTTKPRTGKRPSKAKTDYNEDEY